MRAIPQPVAYSRQQIELEVEVPGHTFLGDLGQRRDIHVFGQVLRRVREQRSHDLGRDPMSAKIPDEERPRLVVGQCQGDSGHQGEILVAVTVRGPKRQRAGDRDHFQQSQADGMTEMNIGVRCAVPQLEQGGDLVRAGMFADRVDGRARDERVAIGEPAPGERPGRDCRLSFQPGISARTRMA